MLCLINIFSKYAWVICLKVKKIITTTNAFQKVLDKPNPKPNKVWDEGNGCYNKLMKSWLDG